MKDHHCTSIVPLFNRLTEEEQEQIESLIIHRHFRKGETVWQPGENPLLIIVASGSMKVYMISGNGREQLLRLLTPGSYEGANALLGAKPQDLYIDTLTETDACLLRKSDFNALLEKTPQLSLRLLELYAQRMADTENQTRFLIMEKIETRLSAYLMSLFLQHDESLGLEIPMKMKDLSAYLGTTPETLSRKLRLLEEKEIIRRKGKKIQILNKEALETLAEE
ncbi:Crp/Fnr family transcriptional regulator [Dialister sp.]|uniref:Crp/Fnr family transcriptional regulator n=1 Tax=Dialister sp. TaxID=1955814 RepID=UPI003F090631